jgi:hypothetical protein
VLLTDETVGDRISLNCGFGEDLFSDGDEGQEYNSRLSEFGFASLFPEGAFRGT